MLLTLVSTEKTLYTIPPSSAFRDTEQKTVPAKYKKQYNYWGFKDPNGRYHFCAGAGRYYYGTKFTRIDSGWRDTQLTYTSMSGQTCSGGMSECWHTGRVDIYGKYGSNPTYFWEDTCDVVDVAAYTEYRYRDNIPTYYFRRFKAWSEWGDAAVAGDAVETRVLYRYRDKVLVYEPVDDGNVETKEYQVKGTLSGLAENYAGRRATVLVYKKTNADPTASQLQYVGQTAIGENNSYEFVFYPKEIPSAETGDFIVTLALEGASRLVQVDIIKAPKQMYEVRFISEGQLVASRVVEAGGIAVHPNVPKRPGYSFVGWSDETTDIDSSRTLIAQYVKNTYSVVFVDMEKNEITAVQFEYGASLFLPELEPVAGYADRQWDVAPQNIFVTDNMVIKTKAVPMKYSVKFLDDKDSLLSAQQIEHGKAAIPPINLPAYTDRTFADWVGNCDYRHIVSDAVFKPAYFYPSTVDTPKISVTANNESQKTITIDCTTPNAVVYYIIESENADDTGQLMDIYEMNVQLLAENELPSDPFMSRAVRYTKPIVADGDASVMCVAYASGMNGSIRVISDPNMEYGLCTSKIEKNTLSLNGGKLTGGVVYKVTNDHFIYYGCAAVFAVYDKNGRLLKICEKTVDIKPGDNTISFDAHDYGTVESDGCTARLFIWEGTSSLLPVAGVNSVNVA